MKLKTRNPNHSVKQSQKFYFWLFPQGNMLSPPFTIPSLLAQPQASHSRNSCQSEDPVESHKTSIIDAKHEDTRNGTHCIRQHEDDQQGIQDVPETS